MRKSEEISRADSCLNRALPNENVFVLLGRDAAAPTTIRYWAAVRVLRGVNRDTDTEIVEARALADAMDAEYAALRKQLGKE